MEIQPDFWSYFNPKSESFSKYTFSELSVPQKIATVFCSLIGLVGFGIGALAAYRYCVKRFFPIKIGTESTTPSATKTHEVATRKSIVLPRASQEQVQPKVSQKAQSKVAKQPAKTLQAELDKLGIPKKIKSSTEIGRNKMKQYFEGKNEKYGSAADNGDCFYDALSQSLSLVGKNYSVDDLRGMVKEYVDKHPSEISDWYEKHPYEHPGYEEYVKNVGKSAENIDYPIWGRQDVEGKDSFRTFRCKN